jgi:L-alanine-DL-glutamate epimerase-like enolase superfamily enzyme
MAELARAHRARGFRVFKVKIGKHLDDDLRALTLIARAVPDARFRLDANAAFTAEQALHVLERTRAAQLVLECFEQPCAREDLAGMAAVTARSHVPVLADESVRDLDDLERIHAAHGAHGVNLKLAKSGGLLAAVRIGQRARELGLRVMCGGMVESRLGMAAMAHVACALGGVDFVDLDTAFLLASDPFQGGYESQGATLTVSEASGLGIRDSNAAI